MLCTNSVLFHTCLCKGEKQIRKEICHFINRFRFPDYGHWRRQWWWQWHNKKDNAQWYMFMCVCVLIVSNSLSICLSSYDAIKLFVLFRSINTLSHTKFTRIHAHAFLNTMLRFYLKITDFDEPEAREKKWVEKARLEWYDEFRAILSHASMKLMCMG